MPNAFIIMQIGNPELDAFCERTIVPALKACGFADPKRVDKHNRGELLKSEIIRFIENADIIVADLTNERPNCYLEVGYAMGAGKLQSVVLTAREDHEPDSLSHRPGGPKVHFDLAGYPIEYWNPDRLEVFSRGLEKVFRRRMADAIPSQNGSASPWDSDWVGERRNDAMKGLSNTGKTGFMEARFALDRPKVTKSRDELKNAAKGAEIHSFGWPIAPYLEGHDDRPRPTSDGIVAEILAGIVFSPNKSFDYWFLRRNGDFYFLGSLFEDIHDSGKVFFDTRIVRVTEVLLYCARLYRHLGVDAATIVNIGVRHGGLRDRTLTCASTGYVAFGPKVCKEDMVEHEISMSLGRIETEAVSLVKEILEPLFVLFDFARIPDQQYEKLVREFVKSSSA